MFQRSGVPVADIPALALDVTLMLPCYGVFEADFHALAFAGCCWVLAASLPRPHSTQNQDVACLLACMPDAVSC